MNFLLETHEQPQPNHFLGDLAKLKIGTSNHIAKLEELIKKFNGLQVVLIVGHPGTGKSSLVTAFHALGLPEGLSTFHNDEVINWRKVIEYVDREPNLGPDDYLRVANAAALQHMKDTLNGQKLVIVDGGGLIEDYEKICQELGFDKPGYIVLDASKKTLERRLETRGDGFKVTAKEISEHEKNVSEYESYGGEKIDTDDMDIENPSKELSDIIEYLCSLLQK